MDIFIGTLHYAMPDSETEHAEQSSLYQEEMEDCLRLFLYLEIISQLLMIFKLYLYGFSDPSQDISSLRELDTLPNWK